MNLLACDDAARLLDQICNKQVLVIGDLMLDRFVDGKVERISPEAPVPILSKTTISTMPGGAANVARNICQLGATCHLVGITGDDEAADELAQALGKIAGLAFQPIIIKGRPTTTKTRFRAGAQQLMRLDDEVCTDLSAEQAEMLKAHASDMIAHCDIVILSDYAKGCLSGGVIKHIIKIAKSANKKVIIDPKSSDFSSYEGAFLVTPNLAELVNATGMTETSDNQIEAAATSLARQHDISYILTTLSARGMRLDGADHHVHIPTFSKDVFDVSGAGDTVVASIALAVAAGADLDRAMIFANQSASIVVSKPGTASFCAGELLAACPPVQEVLTQLDEHKDVLATWRQDGCRIGFTNGCFDILHAGHMHVLREARLLCDKLLVGLNTDRSVSALKGPGRPVQSETIRAGILAALPYCDGVILFDDETPLALIEAIGPDVLIKGGDYQITEIVGHDHVKKTGGDVVTIALLDGHSTTTYLKR
ncbi:MAG: D-glycero-beta-D-manno-heptose-7-phosphate kinase [Candidatus Puniceispirillaceae bacterium]